jgi:hypothetical protein
MRRRFSNRCRFYLLYGENGVRAQCLAPLPGLSEHFVKYM